MHGKFCVKMEKALGWVEDMKRKHFPTDGNLSCQKALSLYEDFSQQSKRKKQNMWGSVLSVVSGTHQGSWNESPLDTGDTKLQYTLGFKEGIEHHLLGVRKCFTMFEVNLERTQLCEGNCKQRWEWRSMGLKDPV